MAAPRVILIGSIALFGLIGICGLLKKSISHPIAEESEGVVVQEEEIKPVKRAPKIQEIIESPKTTPSTFSKLVDEADDLPDIDRVFQLFTTGPLKLPIVETVTYSSQVSWLQERPAWVADYAAHYETSRHFIARSLHGRPDYFSQQLQEGSCFNVFRLDKKIEFYLVVDLSRCKMAFYYLDLDTNERVLLKTYSVGLGKLDPEAASGSATPLGRFMLGDKVAIYKPGIYGFYGNQEVEMIQIFGTRWLPIGNGYGIEGAPWMVGSEGALVEDLSVIGHYSSDGCIRLSQADVEELFSIVLTKPTYVEIVESFQGAVLPGQEVAIPRKS
jgi:L,D-transpeptidase catalytic domain